MTQAEFSRYIGVSRKSVTVMKKKHQIVIVNNKVDVDKSIELLKTLGRTFTQDNKIITSNTTPNTTNNENDKNLLNTEFDYPTLTDEERIRQEKHLIEVEMEKQANELGLSLKDIQTPEIESMEKWEVERFKIFYQGMLERAKYFKEIGKLVDVSEVEEEHFRIARTVRDAVLSMSNRVAHQLINKKNIHEIKKILDNETYKIMENLSK